MLGKKNYFHLYFLSKGKRKKIKKEYFDITKGAYKW